MLLPEFSDGYRIFPVICKPFVVIVTSLIGCVPSEDITKFIIIFKFHVGFRNAKRPPQRTHKRSRSGLNGLGELSG